jgi:hypothetical protein
MSEVYPVYPGSFVVLWIIGCIDTISLETSYCTVQYCTGYTVQYSTRVPFEVSQALIYLKRKEFDLD